MRICYVLAEQPKTLPGEFKPLRWVSAVHRDAGMWEWSRETGIPVDRDTAIRFVHDRLRCGQIPRVWETGTHREVTALLHPSTTTID
jgi:hypothetical protein